MLVIKKTQIKDWLKGLRKSYRVIDIGKDVLPPKQYLFPAREDVFLYNKKSQTLTVPEKNDQKILLFGLDPVDLEAMIQLDQIMTKPQKDFYYWRKRKNTVLVGVDEKPKKVAEGGDVVLEKINSKEYRVNVLTKKGEELTKSPWLKEIKSPVVKKYQPTSNPMKELLLDSELLKDAVAWSVDHKIWDELANECLGCGVCTYVCPLCHCFSVEDNIDLDGENCFRCREWDACTLPKFAKISGGHDFHPTIKERYYNWFYHKFVRAYLEYGKSQCVACGRCFHYCPARISIVEILTEIVEDYRKSNR